MVLDRYIAKAVISGCLMACFVMLSIFAFVDFVAQLKSVGTGEYGALQAALYILLRLPQRLYELAPSILLLGGILSLGAMAANSELIVMRASGISTFRITRAVLQAGFAIAILVALLGEYIVPLSSSTAKAYRAQALDKNLMIGGSNDIWARDGNRYVNVKQIMPNHQLHDIYVYELNDKHQLSSIIHAKHAQLQNGAWLLSDINRSLISDTGVVSSFEQQLILQRLILLELFTVLEMGTNDMSASDLLTYSRYLQENKLDDDEYLLAFWIKVFTPLTCLAMLMIAMPIVFSTTPRSGGVGQRLMLALLIGIIYFVISRSVNHLGLALNLAPVLSALLPLAGVTVISLYFMKRVS